MKRLAEPIRVVLAAARDAKTLPTRAFIRAPNF